MAMPTSLNKFISSIFFLTWLLSKQPTFFEISLGRGVVPALGEGVASEYPPTTEQYTYDNAVIIDTFERILRTGRTVQTGMTGKTFLIEKDRVHTKHFKIRLEKFPPQIFCVLP